MALPDKNRLRVRIVLFVSLAVVCFSLVAEHDGEIFEPRREKSIAAAD